MTQGIKLMTETNQNREFAIQKLYTKDLSFEAPSAPDIFKQEWKPELNLDLQSNAHKLDDENHEVVLTVTVTVKNENKTAFLVEVKQAGIFTLKNFPDEQMGPVLGSVCPSIIFPYVREVVSDVVVRGGFPQLALAPINFDAIYQESMAKQQAQDKEGAEKSGDSVH